MSLFILEDDPKCSGAYEQSLDHGNPVYVPVQSRAPVEAIVCLWTDELRDSRRKDIEDEVVSQKAEKNLMDVVGKRSQAQFLGKRLAGLYEQRGRRYRIPHVGPEKCID
jgi:hypothetical protein